jgi:large subunit ribosomal protein L30
MSEKQAHAAAAIVRVTLLRRPVDRKQATVVRGMGLRRIRHTVSLKDGPSARGMIHKVRHLVRVED